MKRLKSYLLAAALLLSILSFAKEGNDCIPKRPNPPRLVNDFANILSSSDKASLENKLEQFSRKT